MRNDVKLGFAIGGVLLAVLIVYVLVVPGGSSQSKKVSQGTGLSKSSGASGGGTTADGNVKFEPVAGATTQGLPAIPPPSYDPKIASAKSDADKSDTAKAESAKPVDPFAASKGDDAVAKSGPPTSPRGGDLDWNKLLNDQPVLMTETPVATGGAKQAAAPVQAAEPISAAPSSPTNEVASASGAPDVATPAPLTVTPAASPTSQPAAGSRTHVVRSGETLSSISTAAYGDSRHYPAIIKANPGIDPSHMKVGQTINLPALAAVRPTAAATDAIVGGAAGGGVSTPTAGTSAGASASASGGASAQHASAKIGPTAAIDPTKEYRVQSGDSLYKIAVHLYGRGDKADKIFQANKQTIGDDPHRLKVGQLLTLPEAPTVSASAAAAAR